MMEQIDFEQLAKVLMVTAHRAGQSIMRHYASDVSIDYKEDSSPVTAADKAAEAIIVKDLMTICPQIPIVAEESVSAGQIPDIKSVFFLVDPLDGTKEFIHKRGEFTVNIALIEDAAPVFGLVYAPALGNLYITPSRKQAAKTELQVNQDFPSWDSINFTPIHTRIADPEALACVASRSHRDRETDEFLKSYKVTSLTSAGSSNKFCLVAEGEADLYPRFGRTMEWDTAAGHAILTAAGGTLSQIDGAPFLYGKSGAGFANPGFVAWGGPPLKPTESIKN